jgi:hypothetical protein
MNTIGFKGASIPAAKKPAATLGNKLQNLLGKPAAKKPANLEQAGDSFKKANVEKAPKK